MTTPDTAAAAQAIVVVDDDPAVRMFVCRVLRRQGYQLLEANSGTEALKAVDAHTANLSLVISDVNMPEMNGIELTRLLRSKFPSLPALLISGASQHDAAGDGQAVPDGIQFLSKPFTPDGLASRVKEILGVA